LKKKGDWSPLLVWNQLKGEIVVPSGKTGVIAGRHDYMKKGYNERDGSLIKGGGQSFQRTEKGGRGMGDAETASFLREPIRWIKGRQEKEKI